MFPIGWCWWGICIMKNFIMRIIQFYCKLGSVMPYFLEDYKYIALFKESRNLLLRLDMLY